jgi:hypothetical protein
MGSWHATCNISQLPITPGTPVRVLFLAKCPYAIDPPNPLVLGAEYNSREGCYSTDFWYPRTVPLKGEYGDYGEADKLEEKLNLELFWAQLKADILEVPQGENEYHEPGTKPDMDWEHMWWMAYEGRLRVNGNHGMIDYPADMPFVEARKHGKPAEPRALPVTGVFIREDVWQALLKLQHPREDYERGEDGKYHHVAITVENYRLRMRKCLDGMTNKDDAEMRKKYGVSLHRVHDHLLMDRLSPPFCLGISFYLEALADRILEGKVASDSPEVEALLTSMAELVYVMTLYSCLRRSWHPGTGCGSQSTEYEFTAQFHEALAEVGYAAFEEDQKEMAQYDDESKPRKARRLIPKAKPRKKTKK